MVLNQEVERLSPEDIWQTLYTFLVVIIKWGSDYCIQWIEVRDAAIHSAIYRFLTSKDLSGPNVNSAKVEEACFPSPCKT